ncbi:DNA polymerase III subunit beta [Rubidibacter lacunae]|nr:DNA polymerase III subunit beta [Rubidibacter lacunae]
MKLTCSQSDLNAHLSSVSRAVPSRPAHPILGNVLLEADEAAQTVKLTAFDHSLGLQASFPAQVSETSAVALPARLLNDLVARLPEGELTLSCAPVEADKLEGGVLGTIVHTSGRYQLRGTSAKEFPELPAVAGEPIDLEAAMLAEGLAATLFAASPDETKQVLTGVHLTQPEGGLEFAATDGHRLVVVETTSEEDVPPSAGPTLAVTIPARALRELERMLSSCEPGERVMFRADDRQVVFEFGNRRLTSRKLDGAYPAYRQLIPQQFERRLTVDRRRLQSSLEVASVMADQKNNIVKFSLDSAGQELSLSVDAQDVGNARESLPAQITGESMDIAFNIRYLMDGLKVLQASEVQIQLNSSTQPAIVTPVGGQKLTYLVMPVQLRK